MLLRDDKHLVTATSRRPNGRAQFGRADQRRRPGKLQTRELSVGESVCCTSEFAKLRVRPNEGYAVYQACGETPRQKCRTSPSIDLRFTLVLKSTKLKARQREVLLCPSPSAPNSALMRSPRPSAKVVWVRFTAHAT